MTLQRPRTPRLAGVLTLLVAALVMEQGCSSDDGETDDGGAGGAGVCATATCDGACVDTDTSAAHCGTCGNACDADRVCVGGACLCNGAGIAQCADVCTDINTDPGNCGACGTMCSEQQVCAGGQCDCPQGFGTCSKGCADLMTDKLNCGQCNIACSGAQECVGGNCECSDNLTFCFGQCVDTKTHSSFCGDCDTKCAAGQTCAASACEDILSCADVAEDMHEGTSTNDVCADGTPLPAAVEGAATPVTLSDPTLHHVNGDLDTDWYTVLADEGDHICLPGSDQCYFIFNVAFTPPDAAAYQDYQVCVTAGACGGTEICSEMADWNDTDKRYNLSLSKTGTCGFEDGETFHIKVARDGGQESCEAYSLEYSFEFTDEACS